MRWSTGPLLRPLSLLVAILVALVGVAACAEHPSESSGQPSAGPQAAAAKPPRIASLSPALTATAARLGLAGHVVGRTPWCDSVDPAIPVVGSLNDFDAERLVRLAPTHLLVQPPRAGIDQGLARLAASHGWTLMVQPIDGIEDVKAAIERMPTVLAGPHATVDPALAERAQTLVRDIDEALAADGSAVALASPVLLLFSLDPPMAFGSGSYLGDMLERLGGRNAIDADGYPQLSLEDIHRAAPRSVVLVQAGEGSATASADTDPWALLRPLRLAALTEGRCAVLRHPSAHTPGPDVAAVATELTRVLERCAGGPTALPTPKDGST